RPGRRCRRRCRRWGWPVQRHARLVAAGIPAAQWERGALEGGRDLGGGEGVGSGVAGEGEAAVTVLGGDELGEGSVATRRPGGRVRVLAGGDQGLEDERGGIRIGAGPGLVGEAAVTTLLAVQPPQCAAVPAVHPGGVQG